MKLPRKQFVFFNDSRMYNKFCALANVSERFLLRGHSGASRLLSSCLGAAEDHFKEKAALLISTSCRQFSI
jgi:hypothetical protein